MLREARFDLRAGNLGERQRPRAPNVRLMRPSKREHDPALAFLLKDPSRTYDRSPVTNLHMLRILNPDA